ncbi:apoptosis-associated speck-like protein containing a CARD [Etheostoma cragini]|uniref:apoptosis-associated speck-like protein containing a CARD n=1 Tax=Etheostoma cragini TaxID=417921 RepID=UPI00155E99B5|nr:apoptosis-associated speck-like protein containing a CARD [Etheostoma cragini]
MADEKHFVDEHRIKLIEKVSNIPAILDELLCENVIQKDSYDKISALPTSKEKMRELFSGPLKASGVQGKEMFYKILNKHEPYLMNDLKTEVPVETMTAKKILFETLNDLSSEELHTFNSLFELENGFPLSQRGLLEMANTKVIVELMVETYSHECVELTKKVLKRMNRTDLVQRLSDISSGTKEKQGPLLTQRVETMTSVIELLLETLKELKDKELHKFKSVLICQTDFNRHFLDTQWILKNLERQNIVFSMVENYGQQSVEKTKKVLKTIKRTDLVEKLSDISSKPKKKHSVDEYPSALIHKVATKSAFIELLLETLNGLSSKELDNFIQLLHSRVLLRSDPDISWRRLLWTIADEPVVELAKEVLTEMNRTDLVQRLSETILETKATGLSAEALGVSTIEKENQSVDKHGPARILRAAALETQELAETKEEILRKRSIESQVAVIEKPETHQSKLLLKDVTMTSLEEKLWETLEDLSYGELEQFKHCVLHTRKEKGFSRFSRQRMKMAGRDEMVELMVEIYGQRSVEVTREVLEKMNRRDLVQRLSLGLQDTHKSKHLHQDVTMTSLEEKLSETLEALSYGELEQFKHILQHTRMKKGLPRFSRQRMEMADRDEMVELMMEIYNQRSVEVTMEVLIEMNRRDLVQRLLETRSGSKEIFNQGPSEIVDPMVGSTRVYPYIYTQNQGATGKALNWDPLGRDSTPGIKDCPLPDWTDLEPEVNSPDAAEAPTYSLQSEAGNFQCSVSGLRWVCKEKVSFKYQFCSWEGIMERMERLQYMPAGSLMDITVIAGKLNEVYLPHWICIDDNPKISGKFAVLHIDDCGDVVEKVSEVTSSHVKLSEPVFSPRATLMKMGLPVKIDCQVLIYYISNTSFLRLHVYLIPHDHGLQQTVDKKKEEKGYKRIEKPRPDKYLKMQQGFKLAADINVAKILPEEITLRYDSQDPNFYEVFIENPDTNFHLTLLPLNKKKKDTPQCEPVWICEIQKVDYQNSADSEETCGQSPRHGQSDKKPSLDAHLSALMVKAATVTTDRERILIMLQDLNQQEFKQFKWQLEYGDIGEGRERILSCKLENSDMFDLVTQLWTTYIQQSVEVTMKVLKQINRNDLLQILSDTSSGSKEKLCE